VGRYVLRRLLQMIPVVIGTTLIIFALVYALPGDPLAGKCGERGCPEEYIRMQTEKFHLDDPLPVQYGYYLLNLAQGDFGEQWNGEKVSDQLLRAYPTTLKLAFVAVLFEIVIGLGAGVVAGIRRGGIFDTSVLGTTLVLISIPVFVIGTTLAWFLGVRLGWFPPTATNATWRELILPGFVLGSLSLAYVARLTRTSLAENLRADYVRTARAKGLAHTRVIGVHTLRNSLIPVVTFIGADFGTLLGGAIVTERVFNIPGVGSLVYLGIRLREGALVVGVVTALVLVFLLVNLLVDLFYAVLDPRIRYE
jgi:oligopeptide transport system permease protein